VSEPSANQGSRISWERARAICGNAAPPSEVWESQFDYNDDDLKRLAATPYREIDPSDLWYYFHDLAHVPLQPDLFNYLFPVCLMDWHKSLMSNEPCSHGDSDFHHSLWHGDILEKMLTRRQRDDVIAFFRDSFLERVDIERGFAKSGSRTPAYAWIGRLNSLARVIPCINLLWKPWWNMDSPGRAVCVLQYCSGLIYVDGEQNPAFDPWTEDRGGGGPCLTSRDSFGLHDQGWIQPNLDFLRRTLSFHYVLRNAKQAADYLANEPERDIARQIAADAAEKRETVEFRIEDLLTTLDGEGGH
jgi:hypothetical protein